MTKDLFERPSGGELAILVHVDLPAGEGQEDFDEFVLLAKSAGADIAAAVTGRRHSPDAKLFVGKGKAEEIKTLIDVKGADVVLFNHPLTPAQQRNLEKLFDRQVLDRTALILDIFAQRARTFEGKLQVELAQLKHQATRLVRGWTHLERQKGGLGLRGPGETQLESDRRMIRHKIKSIHKRMEKVRKQRQQSRRARQRAETPTISLVGYTNAGKSTLFNTLTEAEAYVADQLFATLDPTIRRVDLPQLGPVVIADTVGFIRHLPHDLVDAFRATLEETREADLLLHVVDVQDPRWRDNVDQVNQVLQEIAAEDVPQLMVYNKIDQLAGVEPHLDRDSDNGVVNGVWLSAAQNQGMSLLRKAVFERLYHEIVFKHLVLEPKQAQLRAQLYQLGAIVAETIDDDGCFHLSIRLPLADYQRLFGEMKTDKE